MQSLVKVKGQDSRKDSIIRARGYHIGVNGTYVCRYFPY